MCPVAPPPRSAAFAPAVIPLSVCRFAVVLGLLCLERDETSRLVPVGGPAADGVHRLGGGHPESGRDGLAGGRLRGGGGARRGPRGRSHPGRRVRRERGLGLSYRRLAAPHRGAPLRQRGTDRSHASVGSLHAAAPRLRLGFETSAGVDVLVARGWFLCAQGRYQNYSVAPNPFGMEREQVGSAYLGVGFRL
jgi:hypothetical protein